MNKTNKTLNGFFTVDYEDGNGESYNGLIITYGDKEKRFYTGDPLIDWYDYCKFMYNGESLQELISVTICSSSVDHWFMDTKDYLEKYLKRNELGEYDFMTTDELYKLSINDIGKHMKCVIHKDMKSFQDLINYYKLHKNK